VYVPAAVIETDGKVATPPDATALPPAIAAAADSVTAEE
jgi:hypothetical protein